MTRRASTMKKLKPRSSSELLAPAFWLALVILCIVSSAFGQTMDAVRVISRPVDRKAELPGEFVPYLSVPIHAKIPGFVDKVEVDRGSVVKEGQLLATMIAPELNAQRAEAKAKVSAAQSQKVEAEARVAAVQSTDRKSTRLNSSHGYI